MSENEDNDVLDDVQDIGQMRNYGNVRAIRGIDREAGVVLYLSGIGPKYGGGLTAIPIDETDLE